MIRVSVIYPNGEDAHFDHIYYGQHHATLVQEKMGSFGLVRFEIDKGHAGGKPGSPPPFLAVGHMIFHTEDAFRKGFAAVGRDLSADMVNYTNVQPLLQISQII